MNDAPLTITKLDFWVPGIPVPKGSAKAFFNKRIGRAIVVQDNAEKQRPWASLISLTAQQQMGGAAILDCAVTLTCAFHLPRPKGHHRPDGSVRSSAPRYPTVKPDADKLLRLVGDALTGVVWKDDSQVVQIIVAKGYAAERGPGVQVEVERVNF